MLKASFKKYRFNFKIPGGTSRGVLTIKDSWFIIIYDASNPEIAGIGECSIIKKLSIDDRPDFEIKLTEVCTTINRHNFWLSKGLVDFPAIRFGLEMALLDLKTKGKRQLFSSDFLKGKRGIPINGLVWMGDYNFMRNQIIEKINTGFRCIKIKIGAIDFKDELRLLKMIREDFSENELELRVDANGAFRPEKALEKLKKLSDFKIHSIEQPIRQGKWQEMAGLCKITPLPIALDEELIGITKAEDKTILLETIQPQYIILKPSLVGGFIQSEEFIDIAEKNKIGWWVTSALEGNIGLNAIAQWTTTLNNNLPHGLGTGQLFTNNITSPLFIEKAQLFYDPMKAWNLNVILA